MIKNNLLGQILIALLVLFLLISSIQMFGWGQGINEVKIDVENQIKLPVVPSGNGSNDLNNNQNNDKQLVSNINNRPLFSDSRKPFVEEIDAESEADKNEELLAVNELKAQLTGVVITPEHSYAMILDNLTNERETYKIGMPLNGEQGGWTLSEIHNRKVVFVSDDEKSEELELEVFSGKMMVGGLVKKGVAKGVTKRQNLSRKDKKKNADDIRKKIAERRAQMRAEAAKKK
jgi:hypothetical protein